MKKTIKTITTKAVEREIEAHEEYLEARREKAAAYRKARKERENAKREKHNANARAYRAYLKSLKEEEAEEARKEVVRAKARLYRWKRNLTGSFPPSKVPHDKKLVKANAKTFILTAIREGEVSAPRGTITAIKAA